MTVALVVLCIAGAFVSFAKAAGAKNSALAASSVTAGVLWAIAAIAIGILL